MHREFTTAYTQAHARALCKEGWRAVEVRDQRTIDGPARETRTGVMGWDIDGFEARMVRAVKEKRP